jgi:hypothetical protein
MPRFGVEHKEKWPIGINNPVERIGPRNRNVTIPLDVIVTREPGPIQTLVWRGFRFLVGVLLPLAVVGVLVYSGWKSVTYPAELRAARLRQDMGEIQAGLGYLGDVVSTAVQPTAVGIVSIVCGLGFLIPLLWLAGAGIVSWVRFVFGWADDAPRPRDW